MMMVLVLIVNNANTLVKNARTKIPVQFVWTILIERVIVVVKTVIMT